jgi:hypothetical protein
MYPPAVHAHTQRYADDDSDPAATKMSVSDISRGVGLVIRGRIARTSLWVCHWLVSQIPPLTLWFCLLRHTLGGAKIRPIFARGTSRRAMDGYHPGWFFSRRSGILTRTVVPSATSNDNSPLSLSTHHLSSHNPSPIPCWRSVSAPDSIGTSSFSGIPGPSSTIVMIYPSGLSVIATVTAVVACWNAFSSASEQLVHDAVGKTNRSYVA